MRIILLLIITILYQWITVIIFKLTIMLIPREKKEEWEYNNYIYMLSIVPNRIILFIKTIIKKDNK